MQADLCASGCSGRGTCRQGFCHCEPGYFGRDCSRSSAFEKPDNYSPLRPMGCNRLRIYVYELPWQVRG